MRLLGGARAPGFSLVEIAIVLVVIGLIVSGGLLGLSPVLQANKVTQTNTQMDKIEQSLVLYVIQNGCLPCPADPRNVADATANAGRALDTTGAYTTGCSAAIATACTNTQGLVPWVNLGLAKADVLDGYGQLIDYATATGVNYSLTRTPPSTYTAGSLRVNDYAAVEQTPSTSRAAYVLISHGMDGSYAFTGFTNAATAATAGQKPDPNSGTRQQSNRAGGGPGGPFTASAAYYQDTAKSAAGANGYFDDIVRYKTGPVIIQSCGSNACGNPA